MRMACGLRIRPRIVSLISAGEIQPYLVPVELQKSVMGVLGNGVRET